MITVDWNEKCGEATFRQSIDGTDYIYTLDLYVGNAFLVMIHDNGDERNLNCFFVDASHMERCLKNGIFTGFDKLTAITINKAKCRNYKKIITLLAEYLDDIDISVYKDGNYSWHEFPEPRKVISDMRMRELAETVISYLDDECMLNEFLEDRGIELTSEEKSYFGIWEDNDEEY